VPGQHNDEWATIGKVVALFGVRGELKVRSLTDIPNRFAELDTVYLGEQHVPRAIERVRPYKSDLVVLKFKGLDDANAAESLRNADVQIPLQQLAKLPPDSYYQHDILGLQVYTLDNVPLGRIVDIIETGGNDVYVINTGGSNTALIPAIKDVVKQIDLQRRTMHIDPIPGLLDNSDRQDNQDNQDNLSNQDKEEERETLA
jgi:16S rRNA processing protein RimM